MFIVRSTTVFAFSLFFAMPFARSESSELRLDTLSKPRGVDSHYIDYASGVNGIYVPLSRGKDPTLVLLGVSRNGTAKKGEEVSYSIAKADGPELTYGTIGLDLFRAVKCLSGICKNDDVEIQLVFDGDNSGYTAAGKIFNIYENGLFLVEVNKIIDHPERPIDVVFAAKASMIHKLNHSK